MSRMRRARGRGQQREGSGRRRKISLGRPLIGLALVAVIAVVVVIVLSGGGGDSTSEEANCDASLPGVCVNLAEIYGSPYPGTAGHVAVPVDYEEAGNTNPPVGGPHWSGNCGEDPSEASAFCGPVLWGIYREPWEPATLVHNMEHGGAVLWYNTSDDALVSEMEDTIRELLGDLDLIVMAPYPDMEEETIALTSWSRIDKFPVDEYSEERVSDFMETHVRRFNPENF